MASTEIHASDALEYIRDDPHDLPRSLDPFTVNVHRGFLPLQAPEVDLPKAFTPVQQLVERMPISTSSGPGLLASFQLGPTIDLGSVLPDLASEVDNLVAPDGKPDLVAVTAVFRDYSFLASAYLLEPCWERRCKGERGLEIHPFMAYAAAYCLYNYRNGFTSSQDPTAYTNLRLICAFEHGLDPCSSEHGFIATHIDMVSAGSPALVRGSIDLLDAIASKPTNASNHSLTQPLHLLLEAMSAIEASMDKMWSHSKPKDYTSYRTFIFGITNQSMFPNGVVYEGENNNEPMFFRGESGANDSMIPLLDSLLQIPMPENPLTAILRDFRSYRPKPHREFLAYVRQRAEKLGVREACQEDAETAVLYLRLLDHVRSFRWRHWLFSREYILRQTKYAVATGGSPIVTWLPNQLFAVMDLMNQVWEGMGEEGRDGAGKKAMEMMGNVKEQRAKLEGEVEKWCKDREA
ncbi:hypothetical protein B0A48_05903 [Cryoendolithus antarcticus]|uniref:Indoleamine 2,3-dioxygenase n=1 Tax=Cryoendolithus antarcticus TaxID=1507870 RepID=A0A1V8TCS3_9PEZI|nr:hypothetical protein B0A48_05903 [Cryoendolithus antarcticus]